jgi:hypothetical protein
MFMPVEDRVAVYVSPGSDQNLAGLRFASGDDGHSCVKRGSLFNKYVAPIPRNLDTSQPDVTCHFNAQQSVIDIPATRGKAHTEPVAELDWFAPRHYFRPQISRNASICPRHIGQVLDRVSERAATTDN